MKKRNSTFRTLYTQYQRYRRKLARIEAGTSKYKRRDIIIKRIQKLYAQLLELKQRHQMKALKYAAGVGLVIGSMTLGNAQGLELKTDNPLRFAHNEGNSRPVLHDWDGDGDLDLFVGGQVVNALDSSAAGVRYYTNTDGAFFPADSPFPADLGIDGVGSDISAPDSIAVNLAFVDLDGDGDSDAFVGQSNGTLLYYRNDDQTFVKADASENPFAGIKIGDSKNANPTFVDVDGDGDMDAVIGKYDGLLAYYLNDEGTFVNQTNGADDPNPFADLNVTEQAAPAFADWDGDGDMDLIVGNKAGELAYFRNDDGAYTVVDATENPFAGIAPGLDASPTVGDVDGDGDLDLIFGDEAGLLFYARNDEGTVVLLHRNSIGITDDLSASSSHSFGDIDGDGDQDLARGSFEGTVNVLINTDGSFAQAGVNPLDTPAVQVGYISQPSFADIDQDGDDDLFLGSYTDGILYFQNDAGVFTQAMGDANPMGAIEAGDNESIAFIDFDGDGDLDAFIGNKNGQVSYFVNNEGTFVEDAASNPFAGVDFQVEGNPNHPVQVAFADIDGDGDMDGYFGTVDGALRVFDNNGDGTFSEAEGDQNPFANMNFGRSASPAFGDIDGDGDMDLLVTNAAGLTFHFENTGTVAVGDFTQSNQTNVYPNPTQSQLIIEIPWHEKGDAELEIINVTGKTLFKQTTRNQISSLDLAELPIGMYLLKISSEQGKAIKKIYRL